VYEAIRTFRRKLEEGRRCVGPGITLADGRCFFVGGTGRTARYTQPAAPAQAALAK